MFNKDIKIIKSNSNIKVSQDFYSKYILFFLIDLYITESWKNMYNLFYKYNTTLFNIDNKIYDSCAANQYKMNSEGSCDTKESIMVLKTQLCHNRNKLYFKMY